MSENMIPVTVKNKLKSGVPVTATPINPDGTRQASVIITPGEPEAVTLQSQDVSLEISFPDGDVEKKEIRVRSDLKLDMTYSYSGDAAQRVTAGIVKINDSVVNVPTDVNVTVGTEEPD